MNEVYFSGYGYFKVDTNNYDEAVDKLLKALADAGIDLTMDDIELRDAEGNIVDDEVE